MTQDTAPKLSNSELLQWSMTKLKEGQEVKLYGSITFIFENGRLVRSKTEKSEVPK